MSAGLVNLCAAVRAAKKDCCEVVSLCLSRRLFCGSGIAASRKSQVIPPPTLRLARIAGRLQGWPGSGVCLAYTNSYPTSALTATHAVERTEHQEGAMQRCCCVLRPMPGPGS